MAVMNCFCCKVVVPPTVVAGCSLVMYLIAFILELWWIISSDGMVLAPAYVLCVGYFFVFVSAAFLLHGLTVRKTRYLLVWLFTIVVFIVPEAGLVLFITLYYWSFSSLHGLLVIVYWILRTILNVFSIACVHSVYRSWKREKQLSQNQQDFNLGPIIHNDRNIHDKSSENYSRNDYLRNSAYENFGFVDSTQKLNAPHHLDDSLFPSHQRSQSEYQLVNKVASPTYFGSLPSRMSNQCDSQILPLAQLYKPFNEPDHCIAAGSQFDASLFDGMLEKVRFAQNSLPRSFFSKRNVEHNPFGRTQSLCDLQGNYTKISKNNFSIEFLPKSLDTNFDVYTNGIKRVSSLQDINYCGISPNISRRQDFFLNSMGHMGPRGRNNIYKAHSYLSFYAHRIPSSTDCTDNTDEYNDVAL